MTGTDKGWNVDSSKTCKKELIKMMREYKYNRRPNFSNKYTRKGNACENDSIDLYCLHKGKFYKKNEVRLSNEYFTGECDLFDGESFSKATEIVDIKTSWSLDTFPPFFEVTKQEYEYQGQVYMNLSGATKHIVAHCLVNTPATMLVDQKFYKKKEYNIIDIESPEYIEECKRIEREGIFDLAKFIEENPWFEFHSDINEWIYDIPVEKRVREVVVEKDSGIVTKMILRVLECRDWMNRNWDEV